MPHTRESRQAIGRNVVENGGAIRPASERNGEERVLDSGVKVAAYKAPTARVRKTPDGKDPAAPRRPWAAQSFYVPERSRELRILKPSWTAKQIQKQAQEDYKKLPDELKAPYQKLQAEDYERWKREYKEYVDSGKKAAWDKAHPPSEKKAKKTKKSKSGKKKKSRSADSDEEDNEDGSEEEGGEGSDQEDEDEEAAEAREEEEFEQQQEKEKEKAKRKRGGKGKGRGRKRKRNDDSDSDDEVIYADDVDDEEEEGQDALAGIDEAMLEPGYDDGNEMDVGMNEDEEEEEEEEQGTNNNKKKKAKGKKAKAKGVASRTRRATKKQKTAKEEEERVKAEKRKQEEEEDLGYEGDGFEYRGNDLYICGKRIVGRHRTMHRCHLKGCIREYHWIAEGEKMCLGHCNHMYYDHDDEEEEEQQAQQ